MGDNDKNIKKKIMSKAIKKIAKKIAIGALIAVIPAALFWAVIEGLLDELSNSINNLGSTYTSISSSINSDLSEGINITDDKIEQLISVLQKNGISLQSVFLSGDTLGLDETSPEYKNELYQVDTVVNFRSKVTNDDTIKKIEEIFEEEFKDE